jgi:GNAT superfamily N-acetyltransferase
MSAILLRCAELADVPRLVELNHAAYPDLVEEGVVFEASQIRAHIERFPRGQIIAEVDGAIVGAMATLVLPRAIDALSPHTWMGVTDGGTFERHDPSGETLYLADIYVDRSAWGRGVGRALYAALFDLCRSGRWTRIVAGGRLYDYGDVADRMSPQEYVARVMRGELRDRVLASQLRAGFSVRGVLPDYLHDWRSRHFATLLVWENPERRATAALSSIVETTPS